MRQVGKIVAGLEHGGVHQRGQVGVVARLDGQQCRLDGLGLGIVSGEGVRRAACGEHTSPLSS